MLSFPVLSFRRKRDIKNQIQSYFISSPCSIKWDDMQAEQSNSSVRFCGDCKLNVHNLSSLSDEEVVVLLNKKASGERVCTYFYRKEDGTLVTDNCPKQLQQVRNRLQAYAASILVAPASVPSGAEPSAAVPKLTSCSDHIHSRFRSNSTCQLAR